MGINFQDARHQTGKSIAYIRRKCLQALYSLSLVLARSERLYRAWHLELILSDDEAVV
jgi:hypothetical protein